MPATATSLSVKMENKLPYTPGEDSLRVWDAAVVLVSNFLEQAGVRGNFRLRPVKRTRWSGPVIRPIRINHHEHHSVVLTVKVPGTGNENIWEYALVCPAARVEEIYKLAATHAGKLKEAEKEVAAEVGACPAVPIAPVVAVSAEVAPAAPAAAPPALSLSDRLLLEAQRMDDYARSMRTLATRVQQRQERLVHTRTTVQRLREEMAELAEEIRKLEDQELALMEEEADDREAQKVMDAFHILSSAMQPGSGNGNGNGKP